MTKQKSHTVAFFDFDGTLTTRTTTPLFLRFISPLKYYLLMPVLMPVFLSYHAGLVSLDFLNNVLCTLFFRHKSQEKMLQLGDVFAETQIAHYLNDEGMKKLKYHQQAGHHCILVTAAYDVYIRFWAKKYGFNEVLCTEFETTASGQFSGFIKGLTCNGPEKLNKILKLDSSPTETYAYGDSHGDKEMLEYATHSFYRKF